MSNLGNSTSRYTYNHHREQNETSAGGLKGTLVTVDRVVGAERSQNQAAGKISHNLTKQSVSQSKSCSGRTGSKAYRDAIDIASVGTKSHDYADNQAEHVTVRPPRVIRIVGLDIRDDGRDEGNQPCEDRDGQGRERERIAEDIAWAKVGHCEGWI
jgi:hypothetical protein